MQHTHYTTSFIKKTYSIILMCDAVTSPANIGSLFRVADSFGVQKIIFGGTFINISSARLKRTARSTQNWIDNEDGVNLIDKIKSLSSKGYFPVALEITESSKPIDSFNFNKNQKIILILGDEQQGISSKILELCKKHIHISMYGKNSSMNVVHAASIALYEITKQLNNYG